MTKSEELKRDITSLEICVSGFETEINTLLSVKTQDFSLIAKKQKEKSDAQDLLDEKKKKLEMVLFKEKSQSSSVEQKTKLAKYERMNNFYGVVRSGYIISLLRDGKISSVDN